MRRKEKSFQKINIIFFMLLTLTAIVWFSVTSASDATLLEEKKLTKAENFSLKDYNGKEHSLSDFKNSKAIVIMFIATECPVSNAYNERMAKIANEYNNKNISFIGINSNKEESVEDIKAHARENDFEFIILKDWDNKIADKFSAAVTPEIFVLNGEFEILYHGRIDDNRREKDVTSNDLANALDEIISGKAVGLKETKAFGCTIKRIKK